MNVIQRIKRDKKPIQGPHPLRTFQYRFPYQIMLIHMYVAALSIIMLAQILYAFFLFQMHWPMQHNQWMPHMPPRPPTDPFGYPVVPMIPPMRPMYPMRFPGPPAPMAMPQYRPRPPHRFPQHRKQNVISNQNRNKQQDRNK